MIDEFVTAYADDVDEFFVDAVCFDVTAICYDIVDSGQIADDAVDQFGAEGFFVRGFYAAVRDG